MSRNEIKEMKLGTHFKPWSYVTKNALLNATIMLVIEMKRVANPKISFKGRDL